jgi:hypothetical protein
MSKEKASEDVMGDAWDRCAEDVLIKFGVGVLGGAVGTFLFKGKHLKSATVGVGAGVGIGSGYTECQYLLANSKQSLIHKFSNAKRDLS